MPNQTPNFNRGLLKFIKGDATLPHGGGHRMLIHSCNTDGIWGGGFSGSLSKRWKKPEEQYRLWFRAQVLDRVKFQVGEIQIVDIQTDLAVVNMLGEQGAHSTVVETADGKITVPPIRYEAIRSCLGKIAKEAKDRQSSVHAPRFGSGLSGGDWAIIESLVKECLIDKGLNVTIYDLEKK